MTAFTDGAGICLRDGEGLIGGELELHVCWGLASSSSVRTEEIIMCT